MHYDVDYFIRKFAAIPEEMYTVGTLGYPGGPRCANGHCMGHPDLNDRYTEEGAALYRVFQPLRVHRYENGSEITNEERNSAGRYCFKADRINNGLTREYRQSSPKQRILAALRDIKKLQQPERLNAVGEKEVYVVVAPSITKQAQEIVLS